MNIAIVPPVVEVVVRVAVVSATARRARGSEARRFFRIGHPLGEGTRVVLQRGRVQGVVTVGNDGRAATHAISLGTCRSHVPLRSSWRREADGGEDPFEVVLVPFREALERERAAAGSKWARWSPASDGGGRKSGRRGPGPPVPESPGVRKRVVRPFVGDDGPV